ncbi:MAG TPA: cation diffusion facilitator family transporter [Blastocatellia bacterium]|jgi:cation diffusion facilitator family transporter|nr:cation diffusion facilitator family transporter [Blastocatellia bacterium]
MSAQIDSVSNEAYRRGVRRVLLVTLALNVAVVAGKMAAGLLAGSLSVISDAIHSSVDSLNNVVGLVVMKYATAEPDEGHPYGHGKFETLAAFAIAGFLFVTCYQISLSAIERVIAHDAHAPEITALTIGVMVGTIITNIIVTTYERREGRRLQSAFLIADSAHTRSDVMVSCSVLAGLILIRFGFVWLDPVISLGVAAVIAWSGYQIFKSTVPVLVDAAHAPAWRIAEIVRGVPGVHSAHDIRSRSQGGEMFVEMHLHIANEFERDHIASHAITEEIERRLAAEFGRVTATIHVEPLPE